jgi:hypothetical protein
MRSLALLAAITLFPAAAGAGDDLPAPASVYALDHALAKRIFNEYYACGEHREGELKFIGDNLGADCTIQFLENIDGREIARAYRGEGERNEDWYGWGKQVLSPCDCVVRRINVNTETNEPGVLGKPPATFVVLERDDGVHFLLAHLAQLKVEAGDRVTAGQVLGVVGNNGYGRAPHVHIGAWHGETPLQVRFDLRAGD